MLSVQAVAAALTAFRRLCCPFLPLVVGVGRTLGEPAALAVRVVVVLRLVVVGLRARPVRGLAAVTVLERQITGPAGVGAAKPGRAVTAPGATTPAVAGAAARAFRWWLFRGKHLLPEREAQALVLLVVAAVGLAGERTGRVVMVAEKAKLLVAVRVASTRAVAVAVRILVSLLLRVVTVVPVLSTSDTGSHNGSLREGRGRDRHVRTGRP